jgi:hypothetical protein
MALAKYGEPYRIKLEKKRELSRQYVIKFKQAADVVKMSRGSSVTFGWSKDSSGWKDPVVEQIMEALELTGVRVDGCSFNLQIHGKRPQRPWVIKTDNPKLLKELSTKVCKQPQGFHDHLEGSLTVKSGFYNVAMATCILATLYPGVMFDKVPAMPVVPFVQHEHREKYVFESMPSFPVLLATIHKLLTRQEMMADPLALQAVADEAKAMREIGVWADDSVMEKSDRIQQSKQSDEEIHFADLMSIASIKHFEVPWKRKYKGRVVFCGGQVRNQYGGAAKFGQLYSTPTNIQAVNVAILFGLLWNNVIRLADATRAFLQAELLAKQDTYVSLLFEVRLPEWKGVFRNPTVRLQRALYGHPQASAFWDLHLKQVLMADLGFIAIEGHPSVYYHETLRLLVVVYADDILASGPPEFPR